MKCPICGEYEQRMIEIETDQFHEGLVECSICGSSWSVNHGHLELIKDTQLASFLQAQSESIENHDYTWAA